MAILSEAKNGIFWLNLMGICAWIQESKQSRPQFFSTGLCRKNEKANVIISSLRNKQKKFDEKVKNFENDLFLSIMANIAPTPYKPL